MLILLNYIPAIIVTLFFVVILIHLEYSLSSQQKYELKDKYSHNLGNILQVIYTSSNILKRIGKIGLNEKSKLDLIETKCKEASKLLNEIRDL